MKIYATLNENNICTGVSQLSGPVEQPNMIEIPNYSPDYLWKRFDRATGTWSAEKFEPVSTAPLDEFQQLRADVDQLIISALEV